VVDLDRLTAGSDDLTAYHDPGWHGLLAHYLQLLAGIAVEAVGIDRRDVASEAFGDLLSLGLVQTGPGGSDQQPRHQADVETAANDRVELREAPALPERAAVFHRIEQYVVEALHGIAATRRCGMCGI